MTDEHVHTQRIDVKPEWIDGNGHVNNVVYVEWMQMIATSHSSTWEVDQQMQDLGTTWFARQHVIEYLRPVFLGDPITANTWIESVARVKSVRKYTFVRDGELVARGETDWVYVDVATGRPKRIPKWMQAFVRRNEKETPRAH